VSDAPSTPSPADRPAETPADTPEGRLQQVTAELTARGPETRIDPSLERIEALMDILGQPQRSYPAIHITGTNGKTSTARMVEQLLRHFELRTGRFTSPHVESVTERISLDGEPIEADLFVDTWHDIKPYVAMVDAAQPVPMSFFEIVTAMAYAAFADAPVDVAVVEVGMGGTWDSTNVIDAGVAAIAPISLDHTHLLGDTTAKIAGEKSGIIKKGALAVVAQQPLDAAEVILRRAVEIDAVVAREGMEFGVVHRDIALGGQLLTLRGISGHEYSDVFIPLHGAHQAQNAALALAAVEGFFGVGTAREQPLDDDKVRAAFSGVSSPGRLEVVRSSPTIVLDAAHNPAGARATADAISESFGFTRLVGVIGTSGDKDSAGLLEALEPVLSEVVITQNSTQRATSVDELAETAVEIFGADRVQVELRLDDAIDAAVTLAEEVGELGGSGVLVTGSIITVGEARILLSPR
jgi:dihydrofolate synthase/folylpolyglutamate synthase